MRRELIIGAAFVVGPVDAFGQAERTPARFDRVPLMRAVRERAGELQVADLPARLPKPGLRELRLWYGFGLSGTGMTRMWEDPRGWRVCRYQEEGEVGPGPDAHTPAVPSDSLARVWNAFVAEGLLELPPAPHRPETGMSVVDGYSWVLEWFDGKDYGAAGADNPKTFNSPDDQHLERVVRHASELWKFTIPLCHKRPKRRGPKGGAGESGWRFCRMLEIGVLPAGCSSGIPFPNPYWDFGPRPITSLSIPRSGHVVLRSRAEYDAFMARYARPTIGVQPQPTPPLDFSRYALVVVSIRDSACTSDASDIRTVSNSWPETADTQVVVVSPDAGRAAPCPRLGDRVEALWIRQQLPIVLFSEMQVEDSTIPGWVGWDLMSDRTRGCAWWKLSIFSERYSPLCE